MHRTKFATPRIGRNQNTGKVAVMGLLERHGQIRTMVVADTKRRSLHGGVTKHVEAGSTVYTDALRSYNELDRQYIHQVINHAEKYVDGQIHTNGVENFWSLLKRTLGGTYVSVEPFHLFRYLDEQSFRFNSCAPYLHSLKGRCSQSRSKRKTVPPKETSKAQSSSLSSNCASYVLDEPKDDACAS